MSVWGSCYIIRIICFSQFCPDKSGKVIIKDPHFTRNYLCLFLSQCLWTVIHAMHHSVMPFPPWVNDITQWRLNCYFIGLTLSLWNHYQWHCGYGNVKEKHSNLNNDKSFRALCFFIRKKQSINVSLSEKKMAVMQLKVLPQYLLLSYYEQFSYGARLGHF